MARQNSKFFQVRSPDLTRASWVEQFSLFSSRRVVSSNRKTCYRSRSTNHKNFIRLNNHHSLSQASPWPSITGRETLFMLTIIISFKFFWSHLSHRVFLVNLLTNISKYRTHKVHTYWRTKDPTKLFILVLNYMYVCN